MAFLANASKLIAEKTSGSTTYLHMSNSGNKHHKRTFVNEHGVFTSPNADTLPHFPLPGMLEDLPDPKHAQNTMWANNRWIALGFVPLRLRNWQTKGGASSLISRGAGINCKRISSHSAGTSAPNQKILVPVDSELFHLPDRYGYDANRSYGSRLRAQRAALESAAAFRILMAACSLYIAHDSDIVHCMPRWELALANAGVKHDEIALYRRSELCDFTPHYPRAGVVFKPEALFLHLVPYFLTANVPVWFSWDMSATTTQYAHGFDSKYKPTALDVQEIAVPSPSSTAVNAISPAPAPIPCSGQLVGEDPDTYRARCLVRRQKSMEKETPEQKLAREQREKQHRTPSQPGKKGPLCWLWEKQEGGWWLKNPVSRNAVEDAWPMWAPEQMFYDSIRNEWNICEEWAPDARAPIEDDYEFNDRDDDYPLPQAPPLSMSGRNWNTVHLWHDHCAEDHEDRETLYLPTRSLLDVLEDRFGFLAASTELPGEPKLSWDVTRRTLVDQTADVPLHVQRRVSTFVSLITTDNLPSLPADTWDITCDYGEWAAAKFFSLQMDRVNGDHFYTINSINGPHRPWRLVTSSATTALHCFRETYAGGDTREVVELLVSMGIPFQTFIEGLPRGGVRHPAVSLARRSHGHQCQVYEYAEYERVLRDFLRRPYARAAILQGGIVWRLAVSVFGLKEANERVTLGPSRDVNNHVFMLTIPGHRHLYDDVITEKEMELICGVYKEYTGLGTQTVDISWWPKQTTFVASGLWVGHWTRQCEDWFLGRQRELGSGVAKMRGAREWRSALSLHVRTTRKFATAHEAASQSYIENHKLFA